MALPSVSKCVLCGHLSQVYSHIWYTFTSFHIIVLVLLIKDVTSKVFKISITVQWDMKIQVFWNVLLFWLVHGIVPQKTRILSNTVVRILYLTPKLHMFLWVQISCELLLPGNFLHMYWVFRLLFSFNHQVTAKNSYSSMYSHWCVHAYTSITSEVILQLSCLLFHKCYS